MWRQAVTKNPSVDLHSMQLPLVTTETSCMSLRNLTLTRKLLLAFGLISLITVAEALVVWNSISSVDRGLQRIIEKLIPQNERISELEKTIFRASLETRHAMLVRTEAGFWVAATQVVPLIKAGQIDAAVDMLEAKIIPARNEFLGAIGKQKEWHLEGFAFDGSLAEGRTMLRPALRAEWSQQDFVELSANVFCGGDYNLVVDRDYLSLVAGLHV
jgi:hypothetical protein